MKAVKQHQPTTVRFVLRAIGWTLLVGTVWLASCQSLLRAEPAADSDRTERSAEGPAIPQTR